MITAKVILSTYLKEANKTVTTLELTYPRYIHSELMTHRVFSRNAASSRAIPIEKVIQSVREDTVMPIWTSNKSGMQGEPVTRGNLIHEMNEVWLSAANAACEHAQHLVNLGVHKQNANRMLEPYQHIKVLVTATQWDNWDNLRLHEDAQPEIRELAKEIYVARNRTEPVTAPYHIPYAYTGNNELTGDELDDALKVSASCCAQVSYRKCDDSLDKAKAIFDKLASSDPIHASPFEHQCFDQLSHIGNLGVVQYRQIIEDSKKAGESHGSKQ